MSRKQFKRPLPEILNINSNKPSFYPYSIPIKNAVTEVITLMSNMPNYVLLMLLKI